MNPAAAAAGAAVLRVLKREGPYGRMTRLTGRLVRGITELAAASGKAVQVNRSGSMFTVFFTERTVRDFSSAERADTRLYGRFFRALLREGVCFPHARFMAAFVSARHTDRDIERTLDAVERAFRRM